MSAPFSDVSLYQCKGMQSVPVVGFSSWASRTTCASSLVHEWEGPCHADVAMRLTFLSHVTSVAHVSCVLLVACVLCMDGCLACDLCVAWDPVFHM